MYGYVKGKPTILVDPSGLFSVEEGVIGGIAGCIMGGAGGGWWILPGAALGFISCGWEEGDLERLKEWWKDQGPGLGGPSHHRISCFVGGTKVHRVDGEDAIESLKVGQRVASHDVEIGENASGRIVAVLMDVATHLIHITIPGETLTCTPEHPFWVVGRGWTKARELVNGNALLDIDGQEVPILGVEQEVLCEPVPVYNITIDEDQTYFIGKSKVLVHNKIV